MQTYTHKQAKRFKQVSTIAAVALVLSGTGLSGLQAIQADDGANGATQSGNDGNKGKGLTVTPDSKDLDATTAAAKKAGVQVTDKGTVTKVVKASEAAKAKKDAEASYAKQVTDLKAKTAQQVKQDSAYKKNNDDYNTAMTKHQNDKPVIQGEKSGVTMKVYGDYDESQRGSYNFYDEFESTIDMSGVKNTALLKSAGWLSDSELTIEKATDKKFYTKADVDKENVDYQAVNGDQYIKNPRQGDIYRLTNGAIDGVTGAKYDLIITPTANFPTDTHASFLGFKKGAKNSLVVDAMGTKTSRLSYYFVPHNAEANPKNAKTVAMTFVTSDVDSHQGGETNMGNIGVLNHKDSGVSASQPDAKGVVTYYDTTGDTLEDSSATPRGTMGLFSVGSVFDWAFHRDHTDQSMSHDPWGQYRYNLLGSGATLNAAIKPDKPTPLTATVQKTQIIVTPDVQKDVDAGDNTTNVKGSANGNTFLKGEKMTYSMHASDLPAGRDEFKTLAYHDKLPDGFKFEKAHAVDANGKDVSKQFEMVEKDGDFTANFTADYVKQINQAKATGTALPTVTVSGTAGKDHVTLKNVFDFVVDGDSYESNEVDNDVTDITAHKTVEAGVKDAATGNSIDGKSVVKGQTLTYELTTDDLPAKRANDVKSFSWSDKLPKYVDLKSYKVLDSNGEDVTKNYEDKGDGKRSLQLVRKSVADMNADKTQVFKNDTVFITVVANQDGVNFKNQATNTINGDDRDTNIVTNQTPSFHPEKQDVDSKGKDINGESVKPGDTLHYKVVGDLTDMTNMAITPDELKQGAFTLSDNYDENKLNVTKAVQKDLSITLEKPDATQGDTDGVDDVDGKASDSSDKSDASSNSDSEANTDEKSSSKDASSDAKSATAKSTTAISASDTTNKSDDTDKSDVTDDTNSDGTDDSQATRDTDTNGEVEQQPTDGTVFIGKGTADKFDMNDVTVKWDLKNGRWEITPKDDVAFLQKYAGDKLVVNFNPTVKKGATGVIENTAIQTTFGEDDQTNTVKNPITDETVVEKSEKDHNDVTHTTDVHNKTKEISELQKAPEKQLPTTGSNGPLQRIVNWFMGLAK